MRSVQASLWQNARSLYKALLIVDEIDGHSSFCTECQAGCYEAHEFGRAQVWESLPEYFDLGSWGKSLNEVNLSLVVVIEPTLHVCYNLQQQLIKFMSSIE